MSTNLATPRVPPCVALFPPAPFLPAQFLHAWCPQVREMGRGAPGRLHRLPASPECALPPGWPCSPAAGSSGEGSPVEERTVHPAPKTLGTATVPSHRSLPASARFADEYPIQSGAPGAPLSLTP